ncbi:hypothetical protein G2W53_010559 [Senna tora]|uniref:Uncharacterized protein n=1 Tax=Senna tora TaxID=362788 RepID=A0A834WZI1_9FABA|nr:hypothetical protein G2W53_010559 [Senna tora]
MGSRCPCNLFINLSFSVQQSSCCGKRGLSPASTYNVMITLVYPFFFGSSTDGRPSNKKRYKYGNWPIESPGHSRTVRRSHKMSSDYRS